MSSHLTLCNARLPRWLLAALGQRSEMPLSRLEIANGRIAAIAAETPGLPRSFGSQVWDLQGALVLPTMVDAHLHLDKAFTLERMGPVKPGLLAAIEAMMVDKQNWTAADVRRRAGQGLQWAYEAGVSHARSHCDWWEPDSVPVAWEVLRELAQEWAGRVLLERVSLIPLHLYEERSMAMRLAKQVALSGAGALLGGFVHSTNWSPQALRNLLEAAQQHGLDVDLHVDEELNPAAQGLATTAALLKELRFEARVVCGHTCALAAQPLEQALRTLDAVAGTPITMVSLPVTNLLLQDALLKDPPYGAQVSLHLEKASTGWNAPALAPWLENAIDQASQDFFGKPAMYMGEGGTIPFMGMLGEKFPGAQFMITGVLGPHSNAHGPNEFLHIPMGKRVTACVSKVLFDHHAASLRGETSGSKVAADSGTRHGGHGCC